MVPESGGLGPLGEPQFRRLYVARALSLFGDALVPVALAFGVLVVDPSPSALGFVLASRFVSLVVFLLVAGVVADRLPRKHILIGSDLVRLAAQAITATLLVRGTATVGELVLLAFAYGAGEAFFRPTVSGFVPETVSPSRLQQANALLGMTNSAWTVLGPVAAGVLVATVGPGWAIGADALTFLLSAVFLASIRSVPAQGRRDSTFLRDLAEGWEVFRSRTWLWVDGIYSALGNFAVLAPLLALGPVVAARSLGGAAAWAAIVAAFGCGSVLGGATLLRVRPSRPLLVGVSLLSLLALPTALLAVPASTVVIAAGALAGGFGLSVFTTLFETTVQQQISSGALSRVASIDWLLSLGLFPLGLAAAGPAGEAFGTRVPLLAGSVWILASTAIVLAIPSVRELRRVDEPMPAAAKRAERSLTQPAGDGVPGRGPSCPGPGEPPREGDHAEPVAGEEGGTMIARLWHGWTTREDADVYEELLLREVLPGIGARTHGYRGVHVLRRDQGERVEFVTLTLWDSMDAIRTLVGDDVEAAYVPAKARELLASFDRRSVHYQLVPTVP